MAFTRELRRGGRLAWLMVGMLALGIGATTALFSIVNGVLLRPLQVRDPGRLVLVGERVPQVPESGKFRWFDTPTAVRAWQQQASDFSALAAIQSSSFTLLAGGVPRLLHGAKVSSNFFDLLEVHPQLGRLLVPADEADTGRPMVITDSLWRSAFGADPGILGRHVGVPGGAAGSNATVVGVLPPTFRIAGSELGPMLRGEPTDYFTALRLPPADPVNGVFSDFNYTVMGRLRPGVSQSQALAQINVIQANLARSSQEKLSLYGDILGVRDYAVSAARSELWLLMAGVLAVLLIVCVNLGGLWLTRLADRRREWAIRVALGAAPGRLARQVLGESVGLALAGGALGVVFAALGLHALVAAAPADLPRLNEVRMDWRVLAFGLGMSLAAGLLTGAAPALRLFTSDPQSSLKGSGAATTADRASVRSREGLIALQAALATLLLAAAGLLGISLYRLVSQPAGFSAERAYSATVVFNPYGDSQREQFMRALPAAAAGIPGVTAAGFTSHLPLKGETWIDDIAVPGRTYSDGQKPAVNVRFVSPGYLRAIGIPLLAGRDLAESDRPAGWPPKSEAEEARLPSVILISRATAAALWPGQNPRDAVGRQVLFNGEVHSTIVGVTADARDGDLTSPPPTVVYQPYWEQPPYQVSLVVRSSQSESSLAAPLRAAIARVAPTAPILDLRPLSNLRDSATAPQRYQFFLLLVFAAVALLLAAMGVHALVAHSVARRGKELAIRFTLGAQTADIRKLVYRGGLLPVVVGVGAGLALSIVQARWLASMLFQVSPFSPALLAMVALAVTAAALMACIPPAMRATRADLTAVLRTE